MAMDQQEGNDPIVENMAFVSFDRFDLNDMETETQWPHLSHVVTLVTCGHTCRP